MTESGGRGWTIMTYSGGGRDSDELHLSVDGLVAVVWVGSVQSETALL